MDERKEGKEEERKEGDSVASLEAGIFNVERWKKFCYYVLKRYSLWIHLYVSTYY